MWSIKNLFEKIRQYFTVRKAPETPNRPTIVIGRRYGAASGETAPSTDAPKIKIRAVHRPETEAGSNVYRDEVEVERRNLGGGIVVNRQRKPGRCPICATRGKVIENTDGGDHWKCNECGSTFN